MAACLASLTDLRVFKGTYTSFLQFFHLCSYARIHLPFFVGLEKFGPQGSDLVLTPETFVEWRAGKHFPKERLVAIVRGSGVKNYSSLAVPELAEVVEVGAIATKACLYGSHHSPCLSQNMFLASTNCESCFLKFFRCFSGKSGGTIDAVCPHGVQYATKFLVHAESPAVSASSVGHTVLLVFDEFESIRFSLNLNSC